MLESFQTGSGQTASSRKCRDFPEATLMGKCGQHVATPVVTCGKMCEIEQSVTKCMGNCGTSEKHMFVLTPSGSQRTTTVAAVVSSRRVRAHLLASCSPCNQVWHRLKGYSA